MIKGIKKIISREGLIILVILLLFGIYFWLWDIEVNKFDGYKRKLSHDEVQRYNLYIPRVIKTQSFDILNSIPVDSLLSREQYKLIAKAELLARHGFRNPHFFPLGERGDAETKIQAVEMESDKVRDQAEKWSDERLAGLASVSLEHFNSQINKIDHLTKRNYGEMGVFILICLYPIYLIFRFIFWAIITLKEKES